MKPHEQTLATLRAVLLDIDNKSRRAWVYLPIDREWNLNSPCATLESEEVPPELEDEPDAGIPDFAKRNRLKQALPVTVVQEIVTNALAQKPSATVEDLIKAFLFYHKHDAFIDLVA